MRARGERHCACFKVIMPGHERGLAYACSQRYVVCMCVCLCVCFVTLNLYSVCTCSALHISVAPHLSVVIGVCRDHIAPRVSTRPEPTLGQLFPDSFIHRPRDHYTFRKKNILRDTSISPQGKSFHTHENDNPCRLSPRSRCRLGGCRRRRSS